MNCAPKTYALAFYGAVNEAKNSAEIKRCMNNFLLLIEKNRDQKKMKNIIFAVEKLIIKKTGGRKLLIESARPLSRTNEKIIQSIIRPSDVVEKKVNSDLIAGIKININDELLLDGSFATKIKKMF